MTVIAYRDGIMAADSLNSAGHIVYGQIRKIMRGPAGELCAFMGHTVSGGAFQRWCAAGRPKGRPRLDRDFGGFIVEADGQMRFYDHRLNWGIITGPWFADGAGVEIAIGAMAAGCSAEQAVEIACKYSTACAGPIQVEHLRATNQVEQQAIILPAKKQTAIGGLTDGIARPIPWPYSGDQREPYTGGPPYSRP